MEQPRERKKRAPREPREPREHREPKEPTVGETSNGSKRTCSACQKTLDESEFYTRNGEKKSSRCKNCLRDARREQYNAQKEKERLSIIPEMDKTYQDIVSGITAKNFKKADTALERLYTLYHEVKDKSIKPVAPVKN
jgi:hypothetical protein